MLITHIDSWQHLPCLLYHDCNTVCVCVCVCVYFLSEPRAGKSYTHGPFPLSTAAFPKSMGVLFHSPTSTYFIQLRWLTVCCPCFSFVVGPLHCYPRAPSRLWSAVAFSCCVSLSCFSQKQFNSPLTDFYDMNIF